MYIPAHFKVEDPALTRQFISENNFGILISNSGSHPVATHLPFYFSGDTESLSLFTHLAKANTQCKLLQEQVAQCLVIFHGPHGYVSPSLFSSSRNVPTWNYIAVHVSGKVEIVKDKVESRKLMMQTIRSQEKYFEKQYESLPLEYLDAMYEELLFIKIHVTGVESNFKLSQNKPQQDKLKVADEFEKQGNYSLAEWMRKINRQ